MVLNQRLKSFNFLIIGIRWVFFWGCLLLAFKLGNDLSEDAVEGLFEVSDTGFVATIVLNNLHDRCIGQSNLFVAHLEGI